MNYKELQRLNEIIENLKLLPDSDENIQFVLKLAEESITKETLNNLIGIEKVAEKGDKEKQVLDDISMLKFTNKEINQMQRHSKRNFAQMVVRRG